MHRVVLSIVRVLWLPKFTALQYHIEPCLSVLGAFVLSVLVPPLPSDGLKNCRKCFPHYTWKAVSPTWTNDDSTFLPRDIPPKESKSRHGIGPEACSSPILVLRDRTACYLEGLFV